MLRPCTPAALLGLLLIGCATQEPEDLYPTSSADAAYLASGVVWAVNVGGPEITAIDGVTYLADEGVSGGTLGVSMGIKGSQDSTLYTTYREGAISIAKPIANGAYDLIFRFAEPYDAPVRTRVFDVLAEGEVVIDDLDIRLARDGKHLSGLDRAAAGVEVADGVLDITFDAAVGQPVLQALTVRSRFQDDREWTLAWADEFDYEGAPDSVRWNYDIWPARKVNDEDQAYTDRPKNVRVEDGLLVLEAHREDYNDAKYTSGRIHSQNKGDVLYGKVEVRAKLPVGQGTWPAIWMLPTDPFRYAGNCGNGEDWQGSNECNAWPNSGEIDIMEHVGYDMQTVHGTVHNKAYYWINWEQRKGSIEGRTVESEFHVYTLEWTPDHLYVFMDGTPYFWYFNEGTDWRAWPFDHPFHVILNLAVGGMWGRAGGPIDETVFPARFEVDYVRVYTRG